MFPLLPCLPCLTGNKGNKYPGDTTGGGSGRGWIRGPVPWFLFRTIYCPIATGGRVPVICINKLVP